MRKAMRNGRLLRVQAAYLLYNVVEWASWIAILVWAYDDGGVRAASALAVVQLIPAALFASMAATWLDRLTRARALTVGYVIQALTMASIGLALGVGAPSASVVVLAVVAAVAMTLTRPVHHALLPEISETTAELTAGNSTSGWAEAIGVFLGPLVCSGLMLAAGPSGVLLAMAAASSLAALVTLRMRTYASASLTVGHGAKRQHLLRSVVRDADARLLSGVIFTLNILVGLADILLVVLALDVLEMSQAGPGLLNSAVGLGQIVGAVATVVLVGRRRIAAAVLVAALVAGITFGLSGMVSTPVIAVLLVGLFGASKLFLDIATRTMIQRLLPDRLLVAVFGLQESLMMAALALGSLIAPFLVEIFGPRGAFAVAGAFLPVVALLAYPRLHRLDGTALVPADVLRQLLDVSFLAVLPPRVVERLAREAQPVVAQPDEAVVVEGDVGNRFFLINEGQVRVTRGEQVLRELGPGEWFGELALLRDLPRTATVTAQTTVSLWAVERDSLLAAVGAARPSLDVADEHARRYS
ncbi:MAG TPA: cyclic nucleotide-binding domain-containing protein [Nocardioidaceae bacterium]|nr:cyclic nucleotide-binding domain-containing protein [Nocardioidaceae bacterium]